jgi:glycerol kinase
VISGLTGAADRRHVVRATLDAIAQRTNDIVEVMVGGLPEAPSSLRVDGGLTASAYLMERQADLLGYDVEVAANEESTALGIAALAGIGAGLIPSGSIARANPVGRRFAPRLAHGVRQLERETWRKFVMAARAL